MQSQGHIDICQQVNLTGWATANGGPATVSVVRNDVEVAQVRTTLLREDVNAACETTGTVGFSHRFQRAITAGDTLDFEILGTGVRFQAQPHLARIERLTHGIAPGARGLEIGALDRPFLTRPKFDVVYVDHASKADLIHKYERTGTPDTIEIDAIVEPEIVWRPGVRLGECAGWRTFDFALASQVMEHVADPIGWLNQIAMCLRPGGRINLSLPDKRRTFDHCRTLTTAADMLDAHYRSLDRPRFRTVFDHIVNVAPPPKMPNRDPELIKQAFDVAQLAERGEYVDVHCHVWTSDSFRECWAIIESLNVCRARLDQIWDPAFASNEFILSFVVGTPQETVLGS